MSKNRTIDPNRPALRRLLAFGYKRLFARAALVPLHRTLLTVGLWGLGVLNGESDRLSGEEHLLRRLRRSGGPLVVIDVGAHVGRYALLVRRVHPDAAIVSFEPHPASFAALQQRAAAHGFRAVNMALGEAPGRATLYDRAGAGGSSHASLHREVLTDLHGAAAAARPVEVTTLDAYAADERLERIDLLKIDAEGSELSVLRGARGLLARGAVGAIQLEFNEMNIVSRVFLRDIAAQLPGYALYRLLPDGLLPLAGQPTFVREIFAFQNIVALPER